MTKLFIYKDKNGEIKGFSTSTSFGMQIDGESMEPEETDMVGVDRDELFKNPCNFEIRNSGKKTRISKAKGAKK